MSDNNSPTKIFDFTAKRQENIEQKKRNFERVLYQEFLGTYSEIDSDGTKYPIKMVDISKDGCQFQVPFSKNLDKTFRTGEDITIRIYFTKDSFIPVVVNLKHSSEYVDQKGDAYMRYGGGFDKTLPSFKALGPFIEFIYQFAEHSSIDKGEHKVYFI